MNYKIEKRAEELKAASNDNQDKIIAVIMDVAFDYIGNPRDCLNFIQEIKQIKKAAAEQK
jgi:hypothetical protein